MYRIEPSITAFEISKDLQWKELNSISFANYPFEDNANFFSQYVLDDNTVGLVDCGHPGKLTDDDTAKLTRLFIDAATENVEAIPRRLATVPTHP